MRKENKPLLKRILAAMLSVTLMSGAAVMTPIADFVGTNITANAATYTDSVDAENLKSGDTLKAGAHLVCEDDYFQILDENNNEITDVIDDWNVDKDYTIASITYDGFNKEYTIHVTSAPVVSNAEELLTALAAGGKIQFRNGCDPDFPQARKLRGQFVPAPGARDRELRMGGVLNSLAQVDEQGIDPLRGGEVHHLPPYGAVGQHGFLITGLAAEIPGCAPGVPVSPHV